MVNDEVAAMREALSSHRAMLTGALHSNGDVDIDRAFEIHAGMSRILTHWDEFSAPQQRAVMSTVEYLINTDDEQNDLQSSDGFQDDFEKFEQLQVSLGYG